MPVPILIAAGVAVGLAVSAGTLAVVAHNAKRRLAQTIGKRRVAILGGRGVGKTALLTSLQRPARDNELGSASPRMGGAFVLSVAGQEIQFDVPRDVSGADGLGYHEWKTAFLQADLVWYVFRADLVARREPHELGLVQKHLDMLAEWADRPKPPAFMLIGTWADQDATWVDGPHVLHGRVADADAIKVGLVKLNHAKLVVGSLDTPAHARELVRALAAAQK